jgi:hypothetical protein
MCKAAWHVFAGNAHADVPAVLHRSEVTAADACALFQRVLDGSSTAADTNSSSKKQGANKPPPVAAPAAAAAAGSAVAAAQEAGAAALGRAPLGPEQRQSTFMRCVTHTLLDRLAASNSASGRETATATAAAAVIPKSMQDVIDAGGSGIKQQQQQQGLLLPLEQQRPHLAVPSCVLHDLRGHMLQQDGNQAALDADNALAVACHVQHDGNAESSRPGTSGTSYSALSIYTDRQLTARSNTCDAEAAALQHWQQQQQHRQHGAYMAAAAADRDESPPAAALEAAAAVETPGSINAPDSRTGCSTTCSSTAPSSSNGNAGSSDSSSRSTTATSSTCCSDTSAATSATAAAPDVAAAGRGADVLALQQFQAVLVLLSRKCFPRIANAARAWKLLIERHIQPLADRKRSR